MPYYASGDYYGRGDPGLWGALVAGAKGIAKKLSWPGTPAMQGPIVQAGMPMSGGAIGSAIRGAAGSPIGRAVIGGLASGAAGVALGGMLSGHGGAAGGRHYRRMNPGNVKALRRSMRRVESFAKLAHATINFTKTTRLKKRGKGHR